MRFSRSAAAAAAAFPFVAAQTFTQCNPTEKTCPADVGLNAGSFASDFTSGQHSSWTSAEGTTLNYGSGGAEFTISQAGQAPTIYTDFYIFFGQVEVTMKAAPGTGIVSSIVLLSDDLDEIDWEILGGNTTTVETNFFGKGNTTLYDRAIYYPVANPQTEFHTYTVDWTSEQITWAIDGVVVRTLPYNSPLANNGADYPQTPMQLRLGSWAAGGPGEPAGTVAWAGGSTNFADAPFNMYVQSVKVTNYNPASSYVYEGTSGSWQDIKVVKGSNTASPTGGAGLTTSSVSVTNTHGPTSSITGANVSQTKVAVSSTVTGSSYSMNTASVASLNTQPAEKTATSAIATTVSSFAPTSLVTTSATSPSTPSVTPPPFNGASVNSAWTAGSLLSVLLACMML